MLNNKNPTEALESFDMLARKKDNFIEVLIVITSYLDDSDETKNKIKNKVEEYLTWFNSEEFFKEFGTPSREKIKIVLSCSIKPDDTVFEFVKEMQQRVYSGNASVEIRFG